MGLPYRFLVLLPLLTQQLIASNASPLSARGYTLLPEPQRVSLTGGDFRIDPSWTIESQGLPSQDHTADTLRQDLAERFHLQLAPQRHSGHSIRLAVRPGAAQVGQSQDSNKAALAEQAYVIDLKPDGIVITGNALPGLFYGTQTLLQLLRPRNGELQLPEAHIEDWPDLRLRQIYWDDAHHLDRPEELKRALRQAAFYKINGFALKLEGHFQYKSAPAIVEPYALSGAQLQEITDYGLRYHIQVIPYLDGPAHIAFILKHPEYNKLRQYPESNYELCVTNPDSYKLMFGMFQDLIDATKGSKYFYLSTDEAYYVGLANNSQCQEAPRAKELGSVGKLLAEFITKTANYIHDQGRTVVFWGEFPLKPDDIASLPAHLVNGETYGRQFDALFRKQGIQSMIYTSSEGEEPLFPEYYPLPASRRLHADQQASRRAIDTITKISNDSARQSANLIGMINAGWADMGLHPETFWLGYATAGAASWRPDSPRPEQAVSSFYPLFYGPSVIQPDRLYQLMSGQAQFWSSSWDRKDSTARKPIWGWSYGIFDTPRPAHDQTLALPPAPGPALSYSSDWQAANAKRLQLASDFMAENDELLGLLHANLRTVEHNSYNLEVYLSLAWVYRHNLEMLQSIAKMDELLTSALNSAAKDPKSAVHSLDQALNLAREIQVSRNRVLNDATESWQKSWFPRVSEANGRHFLHQVDDVKDHLPDRTVDMSYLVHRELLLPFGEWTEKIRTARNAFARANSLPETGSSMDWQDLKIVSEVPLGDDND